MQHDSIFRCIQPACARTLPRSVNFCPYCGTAQVDEAARVQGHAGTPPPGPAAPPPPVQANVDEPAVQAPPQDGPGLVVRAAEAAEAAGAAHANPSAWGHNSGNAAGVRPASPPPPLPPLPPLPPVPPLPPPPPGARPQAAGPMPAAPPKRDPVRLRWWILALAALWGIWLLAKPSTRRIEAQMDKAIALAQECKPRDAQTELIALRKTKATPEQLQRVQKELNDAAGMCTRKRQRDKAWREAKSGVEAALRTSSVERARQRLRTFTRRWGEDDQTRALKGEIDARQPEHPRADEVEGGMMW